MKREFTIWFSTFTATIGFASILLLIPACSTTAWKGGNANAEKTIAAAPVSEKGGAQLWAQNCGHCHNLRSPSSYADAQWEVVALHMRVRANLTAEEHTKIVAFLKTAH